MQHDKPSLENSNLKPITVARALVDKAAYMLYERGGTDDSENYCRAVGLVCDWARRTGLDRNNLNDHIRTVGSQAGVPSFGEAMVYAAECAIGDAHQFLHPQDQVDALRRDVAYKLWKMFGDSDEEKNYFQACEMVERWAMGKYGSSRTPTLAKAIEEIRESFRYNSWRESIPEFSRQLFQDLLF